MIRLNRKYIYWYTDNLLPTYLGRYLMNDTLYCLPRCYSSNVRCMLPFLVGSVPGRSISRAASLSFCWMFPESHHQRSFRLELLSQVFDTVNRTIMKKISYPRHSRNNSITKPWTIPYPYPYSSCHPMTHLPRHPLRQWEASFDIWLTDQPAMLREKESACRQARLPHSIFSLFPSGPPALQLQECCIWKGSTS